VRGIPIYDFCDINHAYVIYFKHVKEFLTSASQEGAGEEYFGQAIHPKKKALPDVHK
jgi:hypothetical protein